MAYSEENSSNNHSQFSNSNSQAAESLEDFFKLLLELQATEEDGSNPHNPITTRFNPEANSQKASYLRDSAKNRFPNLKRLQNPHQFLHLLKKILILTRTPKMV